MIKISTTPIWDNGVPYIYIADVYNNIPWTKPYDQVIAELHKSAISLNNLPVFETGFNPVQYSSFLTARLISSPEHLQPLIDHSVRLNLTVEFLSTQFYEEHRLMLAEYILTHKCVDNPEPMVMYFHETKDELCMFSMQNLYEILRPIFPRPRKRELPVEVKSRLKESFDIVLRRNDSRFNFTVSFYQCMVYDLVFRM